MRLRSIGMCVALVVLASCGQKPGVSEEFAGGTLPPGATVNAQGQIVDAEGNVIGQAPGGLDGAAVGGGAIDLGSDDAGTSGGDASTDADSSGGGSGAPPLTGDSTGVTKDTDTIGAHAPLTGAAPVPSDSAHKGNALYWEWLDHNDKRIHGRRVETVLRNDNYNPSQAVAVCKEMVERDRVFFLYGFAGTDQIQACARYAASVAVPY
ncbi:MAG: ABC transporter substrate-binding protein, partial [Actinomycetota bacterium]|nr:ABC transporter substrate-binding protein [Actinomycetota bacterium]